MGAQDQSGHRGIVVRCPACGRGHRFAPPPYPCACGAPVAPPLRDDLPPRPADGGTWAAQWVRVRCGACGRDTHCPRPRLDCSCGTSLLVPVDGPDAGAAADVPDTGAAGWDATGTGAPRTGTADEGGSAAHGRDRGLPEAAERESPTPAPPPPHISLPRTASPRPAFRPLTIRTARDAVDAAALYLRWLGLHDVTQSADPPGSLVDLRGPDVVGHVDPTTGRTTARAVECLWLHGLKASAPSVVFSLAGYTDEALSAADLLLVPLFVLDLTGTPQPVNEAAADLVARGA